jgi:hypothetical protein
MQFREVVMKMTAEALGVETHLGVDPFRSTTIAGAAMSIFRSVFMKEGIIAALPTSIHRKLKAAFAGGRTGCSKTYWKASGGQKGWYVDFTSLYPWVNKYGLYPVGHRKFVSQPKQSPILIL